MLYYYNVLDRVAFSKVEPMTFFNQYRFNLSMEERIWNLENSLHSRRNEDCSELEFGVPLWIILQIKLFLLLPHLGLSRLVNQGQLLLLFTGFFLTSIPLSSCYSCPVK